MKRPFLTSQLILIFPLLLGFSWAAAALRADVQSAWSISGPGTFHYWSMQLSVLLHRAWWAAPEYFVGVTPLLVYGLILCAISVAMVFGVSILVRHRLQGRQLFLVCFFLQAPLFAASLCGARVFAWHYLISHPAKDY